MSDETRAALDEAMTAHFAREPGEIVTGWAAVAQVESADEPDGYGYRWAYSGSPAAASGMTAHAAPYMIEPDDEC